MFRPCLTAFAALLLAGGPRVAAAADGAAAAADDPRAKAAYDRGAEHFKAGEYAAAVSEFTKANRIAPSPILLYNIARAFEEWKQYSSAVQYYELYLKAAPNAADAEAVRAGLPGLQALARQSEQTQMVQLSVTSSPDGADVLIDGRKAGVTPLRAEVAAGKHFVAVERPGFARQSSELSFEEAPVEHAVTLVPIAAPPPAVKAERGAVLPWVLIGTGAALLVGGGIAGSQAQKTADDLAGAERGDYSTQAEWDDERDSGKNLALVADGLFVTGAAALITGGVLLFTDDGDAPTAAQPPAGRSNAWR